MGFAVGWTVLQRETRQHFLTRLAGLMLARRLVANGEHMRINQFSQIELRPDQRKAILLITHYTAQLPAK